MKYQILFILFLISLISSATLSLAPIEKICNLEEGCSIVQHSIYSSTLGIKNSHYGVLVFLFLTIITISQIKNPTKFKILIIKLGIWIGAIIAIYFIYLQKFVLGAFCKYCMTVDLSMLTALAIILFWKTKYEKFP